MRGETLELRDYFRVLRRGWPLVLAFVVIFMALGIGLTLSTTKLYEASVQVFVATSGSANATDLVNGNTFTSDRVQSYTSIANSPEVTGPVLKDLGLKISRDQLAGKISADAPTNKVLINLHVTDHSPKQAATLANAVAAQFNKVVQTTEQSDSSGKSFVKLTVIHPAVVPDSPVEPNATINVALGLILGLVVGIGVVIARDALDNTVKGPEDFAELGLPVLGIVPFDKRTPKNPIAFRADPHGSRAEAYRQLRTNLQFVNIDNAPRIIAVTSGVPGEGKTTTAVNLAAGLAEAGFRVCLIEADLRRPTIAATLGLVADVGFTTVLVGKVTVEEALQNVGRNFAVLTSGPVPPNPSELLISEQATMVIRQVSELVDYTIIDTAPLLPVADGSEVSAMADATLVVHHAGKSTHDQATRSVEALAKVGERPVGVILNMMTRNRSSYSDNYGYYYTYRPNRPDRPRRKGTSEARASAAAPAREIATASEAADATGVEPTAGDPVPPAHLDPVPKHLGDAEAPETAPSAELDLAEPYDQDAYGPAQTPGPTDMTQPISRGLGESGTGHGTQNGATEHDEAVEGLRRR